MFQYIHNAGKKAVLLALAVCMLAAFFTEPAAASSRSVSTDLQETAVKIVDKKVTDTDSSKKKLKKLFTYIQKNYAYARKTGFHVYDGWEKDYAMEMFTEKKGSCYHYAAAYGFLAKAAGFSVRIGVGQTNGFSGKLQAHAWVEVKQNGKWYICDPNMDKYAADSSKKYFLKKRSRLKKTYHGFKDTEYFAISFS